MDQGTASIVGRLAADPKFFGEGDSQRAVFSIAFNRGRDEKRKANFIDCIAWGKRADIMKDFSKGGGIFITGELMQDTYEAKDGSGKRSRVQVNVSSITATAKIRRSDEGANISGGAASSGEGGDVRVGGDNAADFEGIPF